MSQDAVLELPNGISYYVKINESSKNVSGFRHLLQYVDVNKGGIFIFSYYGNGRFKTYILNYNGYEIEYPSTIASHRRSVMIHGMYFTCT